MKHLIFAAAVFPLVTLTACNRADTAEKTREASATVKTVASQAGDKLADSWLTTKIQAQYFADEDIKARYIKVRSRDGVVTLNGRVDNDDLRQQVVNIAKYTDGVTQVQDQLTVGPERVAEDAKPAAGSDRAVATTGTPPYTAPATIGRTDDASVTAFVQSKYFLDDDLKGRHIQVDTSNGVMTLHGDVASDNERAKALLLARTTPGVERVEDALTVDASLTSGSGAGSTPSQPAAASPAPASPAQSADAALTDKLKTRLTSEPQLKAGSVDVTVRDGVALVDGTLPTAAAKQRALSLVRATDGVVQVIDRVKIGKAK
jgi:hyperosmotically inducible protein